MLGFLIGVGLTLYVLNRVRRGGVRPSARRGRRRRREWVLDRLSSHLETSPAQDRVLEEVVDDLMDVFADERGALRSARGAFADLLRGASFDDDALRAAREEQEASFGRVHDAAAAALKTVHEVLDEEQRDRLASFVARGGRAHCGPRRRHLHAA